jgi:hypothetical protein
MSAATRFVRRYPLTGVGAKSVHPAVVRDPPRRCTDRRATNGNLAHVAHNKKRFLMSVTDVPPANILGDGMPIRAKSVVPTGVLRFQPLTLLDTHSCIRVSPDGASLEPGPQVQGMMEPV